jgi:hypothetical protein
MSTLVLGSTPSRMKRVTVEDILRRETYRTVKIISLFNLAVRTSLYLLYVPSLALCLGIQITLSLTVHLVYFIFVIVFFPLPVPPVSPVLYVINLTHELRLSSYLQARNYSRDIGSKMQKHNVVRL